MRNLLRTYLLPSLLLAMLAFQPHEAHAQATRLQVNPSFLPTQVGVNSATPTIVLAQKQDMVARVVCNIDASIVEWVGSSSVSTTTGLQMPAGSCWDFSHTSANIYVISASGTPKVGVVQY